MTTKGFQFSVHYNCTVLKFYKKIWLPKRLIMAVHTTWNPLD